MANLEHLEILSAGVQEWNAWRCDNPLITPDFTEADLSERDLRSGNFTNALFSGARLNQVDLTSSRLLRAHLGYADLRRAVLSKSRLVAAHLCGTDCEGANFERAMLGDTVFSNTSLLNAIGLSSCRHLAPSPVDLRTVARSKGLPAEFLRDCGMNETLISYLPSFVQVPISFYSCFVSYSHRDSAFANRLHECLASQGVSCWLDERELLPGDDIYAYVDQGIRNCDKLLLCCSASSLTSWWVDNEIGAALERERLLSVQHGEARHVLIPLDLDGFLFDTDWRSGFAATIRRRKAVDFRNWSQDRAKFEAQIATTTRALRCDVR
jgi:hypothetical protein